MLHVLTAAPKEPEKRQTKGLFRTKVEVIEPAKSYTEELVEVLRQTCRFDWMMIEHVKIDATLFDYVLAGPKGVFLVKINRTTSAVHMSNRECRHETSLGWKTIHPHPIHELDEITKQIRGRLKRQCGQPVPVTSFLIFPETSRLKVERLRANCSSSFEIIDDVISRTKLELLTEPTIKQIAYYCSERQVHK